MTIKRHDHKTYREMSVPYEDADKANESIQAFFAKVAELRKEHRIADLALIVEVPIMVDDDEARGASTLYLGGYENRLPMLAHEYGKQRKDYEDMLAKVIAGGRLSR